MPAEAKPAAPAAQPEAQPPAAAETPAPTSPQDFIAQAAAKLETAPEVKPAAAAKPAPPPAEPPKAEAPKPAEEAKKPEDPFATRWAQFTEAQRRQRAEAEAHKAELRAEREAMRKEAAELDALRAAKASGSPVKALMALGWSYEDATAEVMGKPVSGRKEAEAQKADPELVALRQEVTKLRQEREAEREAERHRAARAEYRNALVQAAAAKAEDFFLLHGDEEAIDEALSWAESYAQKHGVLPGESFEQAVQETLSHIQQKYEKRLLSERVLTSAKVRQKLAPVAEAPKPADRPQATSAKSPPPSLTNTLAAAAPPRTAKPEPRTKEEFVAAAAAVLQGAD